MTHDTHLTTAITTDPDLSGGVFYVKGGNRFDAQVFAEHTGAILTDEQVDDVDWRAARLLTGHWMRVELDDEGDLNWATEPSVILDALVEQILDSCDPEHIQRMDREDARIQLEASGLEGAEYECDVLLAELAAA